MFGFVGQSVHQVDADIVEAGIAASAESFDGLLRCMSAMKQAEAFIVESLNAHA